MKTRKKHVANKKKSANILEVERKDVTLHRNTEINLNNIGIWCNGNTADSGPAFPGSSPGIPTKRNLPHGKFLLFSSNNACLSLSITASTISLRSLRLCESPSCRCLLRCIFLAKPQRSQRYIYHCETLAHSVLPMCVLCLTMQGLFY